MPAARAAQNRGLIVLEPSKTGVVDLPYPTLPGDDWMIVRTTAVAINPTDWKHAVGEGDMDASNLLLGFDYAGIVEEVGPSPLRPVKKGDRVAGMAHGT
jgi:NADPH:quinone reductase-like Zn-dependent oxidoreductase